MIPAPTLWSEQCRYGIRETTESIPPIIPELQLVGHVNYHTARPSFFNKHQHPDVLEIFYVVRGKVTWWVEGVSAEVAGNELFLVWPRELHGAKHNVVEPSEYYWIQVHLPLLHQSLGKEKSSQLIKDLRRENIRQVSGTLALLPLYQSLLHEHAHRMVYGETVVRETLHLLLSLVLRCAHTQGPALPARSPYHAQITRALHWAKENIAEATLPDLLKVSGLDAPTFRKHFALVVGLSPVQHLIRLRLQHAKEQLARGQTVTDIAHQLGFSSSQYFATVFRKYEGLTPSEFLITLKQGESEEGRGGVGCPP